MKIIVKCLSICGILFVLVACDTNDVDPSNDYSSIITDDILEDKNSVYIDKINQIELVDISSRYNSGDLFEKNSKIVTYEYTVHLTLNELVDTMNDIEIQKLIENFPGTDMTSEYSHNKDGIFTRTSYLYEISDIYMDINNDQYVFSRKRITKNGIDYDPQAIYLKEQREIDKNKRYDVSLKVLNKRYSLRNVTKTEISNFYSEKYLEILRSASSTVGSSKNPTPRLINWSEDVEIIKEYNQVD